MIVRGIDTLEFGLDIVNYLIVFRSYLDTFKQLKQQGQIEGKTYEVEINGLNLTVELSGARFYAYKLTCNDFSVLFAEKMTDENPPIKVRLMAGFLWSYGHQKAYELILQWFESFECEITGSRVSRVDICADSDEVVFLPSDISGVVCRANSKVKHFVSDEFMEGKHFSGFTIGRGNPMLARIYDKTRELKKSGKTWFHYIWKDNEWDGEKSVWRVEFQMRRPVLREFGINSVEQLWGKENELWAYLTQEWLQLKKPSKDNVSRWKVKRKWKIIQKACMQENISPLIREKVREGNLNRLLDQAGGILLSIGAMANQSTLNESLDLLGTWEKRKLEQKGLEFSHEVIKRRRKFC